MEEEWFFKEEIDKGVVRLRERGYSDHCNIYVVRRRVVIDSGTGATDLLAYLRKEELVDEEVTLILTHAHSDHAGGARHFAGREREGVRVLIHEADRRHVEEADDEVEYANRAASWRRKPYEGFEALHFEALGKDVKVTETLKEGDVVEGLRVIHLPGHTPGSIALLDEELKILFTGDMCYEYGLPLDKFKSSNITECVASMKRLSSLKGYQLAFPGHYNVMEPGLVRNVCKSYIKLRG